MTQIPRLGISWQIGDTSGWGVFGLHLTLETLKGQEITPLLLAEPGLNQMSAEHLEAIKPLVAEYRKLAKQVQETGQHMQIKNAVVLHALGNHFFWSGASDAFSGGKNVAFTFFEDLRLTEQSLERLSRFDRILVGSSWNEEALKSVGFKNVHKVIQGVDTKRFKPSRRVGKYGDRFVIFSGGKIELRKGQDLVLEAFKLFHARHPDSILVTAWQNTWPETAKDLAYAPSVNSLPEVRSNGLMDIKGWAVAHGAPEDAFVDIGLVPHSLMPNVLREADAAIFANRAEGGTNLVAMETMACGVPCIISRNTGHRDIIADDNCLALTNQVHIDAPGGMARGWAQSSTGEIVDHLETLYQDRERATKIGKAGAEFIAEFSWANQSALLVETIRDLIADLPKT